MPGGKTNRIPGKILEDSLGQFLNWNPWKRICRNYDWNICRNEVFSWAWRNFCGSLWKNWKNRGGILDGFLKRASGGFFEEIPEGIVERIPENVAGGFSDRLWCIFRKITETNTWSNVWMKTHRNFRYYSLNSYKSWSNFGKNLSWNLKYCFVEIPREIPERIPGYSWEIAIFERLCQSCRRVRYYSQIIVIW